MKTILQILPSLDKINGGVERGTLDVARELSKRKYNISHLELPSYSAHKRFVVNSPYRVWYLIKKYEEHEEFNNRKN